MTNGKRIVTIPRMNPINAFTMVGIVKDTGLTLEGFKKLEFAWFSIKAAITG